MPAFELAQDRMKVYHDALELVVQTDTIHERQSRGRRYLIDQLNRATASIVCNIAEGAGEFSAADKARFYRYALRSATESVGVLDIYRKLDLGQPPHLHAARQLAAEIVAELTGLVRFQQTRRKPSR